MINFSSLKLMGIGIFSVWIFKIILLPTVLLWTLLYIFPGACMYRNGIAMSEDMHTFNHEIMPGIEPRALCKSGKCSMAKLHLQPLHSCLQGSRCSLYLCQQFSSAFNFCQSDGQKSGISL